MTNLLIFGASSLAKQAYYYATRDKNLNVVGFVVHSQYITSNNFLSLPVFDWSELDNKFKHSDIKMHVAIGYREMRLRSGIYDEVKSRGYELVNIIARSSFIAENSDLGDNNLIMPGSVIEPGVKIGSNNVVCSNATICHDSVIGNHNFIAANAIIAGEVSVGDQNFLGFSSVILQQRIIGNENLIGAQSLVLENIGTLTHWHGSPARKIKPINPKVGVLVD